MLVLFGVLAWIYFIPPEFELFGRYLRTGSLFTNLALYGESGYFEISESQFKPLLHFWSLAVEEQFYFLWPLILFVTYRKKIFFFLVFFLFTLSISINILRVNSYPEEIFYLLHARFWELLLGGLIAWYIRIRKNLLPFVVRNILSIVGSLLLAFSFYFITNQNYPGYQAIFPTVATALIILGEEDAWINKYFLSLEELVYIGRISYPLYLWHWPLLVFVRIMRFPEITIWLSILFSFLLASFSYLLIEKPIREASVSTRSNLFWVLSISMVILAGAGHLIYSGFLKPLSSDPRMEKFVKAARESDVLTVDHRSVNEEGVQGRVFGNGKEKILLLGDSHLHMHLPYFLEKLDLNRYEFYDYGKSNCGFFFLTTQSQECSDYIRALVNIAKKSEFSKVIIINYWTFYIPRIELIKRDGLYHERLSSFKNLLQQLNTTDKKVYVLEGTPFGPEFDPLYMLRSRVSRTSKTIRPAVFDLKKFNKLITNFSNDLNRVTESAGATYIYSVSSLCPESKCSVMFRDEPAYRDASHMRRFFVLSKANYLDQIFEDRR